MGEKIKISDYELLTSSDKGLLTSRNAILKHLGKHFVSFSDLIKDLKNKQFVFVGVHPNFKESYQNAGILVERLFSQETKEDVRYNVLGLGCVDVSDQGLLTQWTMGAAGGHELYKAIDKSCINKDELQNYNNVYQAIKNLPKRIRLLALDDKTFQKRGAPFEQQLMAKSLEIALTLDNYSAKNPNHKILIVNDEIYTRGYGMVAGLLKNFLNSKTTVLTHVGGKLFDQDLRPNLNIDNVIVSLEGRIADYLLVGDVSKADVPRKVHYFIHDLSKGFIDTLKEYVFLVKDLNPTYEKEKENIEKYRNAIIQAESKERQKEIEKARKVIKAFEEIENKKDAIETLGIDMKKVQEEYEFAKLVFEEEDPTSAKKKLEEIKNRYDKNEIPLLISLGEDEIHRKLIVTLPVLYDNKGKYNPLEQEIISHVCGALTPIINKKHVLNQVNNDSLVALVLNYNKNKVSVKELREQQEKLVQVMHRVEKDFNNLNIFVRPEMHTTYEFIPIREEEPVKEVRREKRKVALTTPPTVPPTVPPTDKYNREELEKALKGRFMIKHITKVRPVDIIHPLLEHEGKMSTASLIKHVKQQEQYMSYTTKQIRAKIGDLSRSGWITHPSEGQVELSDKIYEVIGKPYKTVEKEEIPVKEMVRGEKPAQEYAFNEFKEAFKDKFKEDDKTKVKASDILYLTYLRGSEINTRALFEELKKQERYKNITLSSFHSKLQSLKITHKYITHPARGITKLTDKVNEVLRQYEPSLKKEKPPIKEDKFKEVIPKYNRSDIEKAFKDELKERTTTKVSGLDILLIMAEHEGSMNPLELNEELKKQEQYKELTYRQLSDRIINLKKEGLVITPEGRRKILEFTPKFYELLKVDNLLEKYKSSEEYKKWQEKEI
ncbi:hypothetical protein AYK26_05700 [Euryarchaeota archaeon SM23-78]|nr:MAG: hypothetical protein AYK26_05700 [Euryarchaeota archaeon SM23-78]MBW3000998.1 hypothetical protein [Candidatus Woesearchaeota archaeon]